MFNKEIVDCNFKGHALVLGLGSGSMANLLHTRLPNFEIDVAEINRDVYEAATQVLGTPISDARLHVHFTDARDIFDKVPSDRMYDIIVLDAYVPGPKIPESISGESYLEKLSNRLSKTGILTFNYCLPFYSPGQQLQYISYFKKHFKHVHMIESTPTSKIIVAYKTEKQRKIQDVLVQQQDMVERCNWPKTTRGARYEIYLSDNDWPTDYERKLHQESTRHFCRNKQLDQNYCDWFGDRDRVSEQSGYSFGSLAIEEALTEAKGDVAKATETLLRKKKEEQQISS